MLFDEYHKFYLMNCHFCFQELIKTDRARELEQQRAAEEAAARAAALKDLATKGKARTQA